MVDQSLFDDFDAPGAVSHGLPAEAYIGDDFMRVERDAVVSVARSAGRNSRVP
jgi:hypothetical protein